MAMAEKAGMVVLASAGSLQRPASRRSRCGAQRGCLLPPSSRPTVLYGHRGPQLRVAAAARPRAGHVHLLATRAPSEAASSEGVPE